MSYRIELVPAARAEIRALPGYVRAQALELLAALGREPRPPRARLLPSSANLPGSDIYRIWLAGRWRVAYEIDEDSRRVLVLCLRRKERIDYDPLPSWMHDSGADFRPVEGIMDQRSSSCQRSRPRSRSLTRTSTASPTVCSRVPSARRRVTRSRPWATRSPSRSLRWWM